MTMAQLRETVISRDRECVAARLDKLHDRCVDRYGTPHPPTYYWLLTLEHVKKDGRRIDSADHCIALCYRANVEEHWSSPPENNRLANAYLFGIAVRERAG